MNVHTRNKLAYQQIDLLQTSEWNTRFLKRITRENGMPLQVRLIDGQLRAD